MPYAQTSLRAEKRALREKMRDMGLSRHAIAGELARPSGCAPPALAPRNPAPLRSHPAVAPGGRTLAPPDLASRSSAVPGASSATRPQLVPPASGHLYRIWYGQSGHLAAGSAPNPV